MFKTILKSKFEYLVESKLDMKDRGKMKFKDQKLFKNMFHIRTNLSKEKIPNVLIFGVPKQRQKHLDYWQRLNGNPKNKNENSLLLLL